jgi:hypothetical protein
MKNNKTGKVLQELFINDLFIGICFWSLIIIILIPFIPLPQSLSMTLYIFFVAVSLICLPFSLFKIRTALYLAKKGLELSTTNISIAPSYFGKKVTFEYEYAGQKYCNVKFFSSIFFAEKAPLKLLIDTVKPSKYIIVEFRKRSVFSVVRERNS